MLLRRTLLKNRSAQLCQVARQSFSATDAEKESARGEWGIKYDDECLKFEKEWKAIADSVTAEQNIYLEKELGDLQRKKVDMLADKVLDMNLFEMRYF
jgi:hypothetical protein